MKKTMFMVALAAMSLASCSNDEVVEVQKDAIKFNVALDNASRAVIKTATLDKFNVYGYAATTDGSTALYMTGEAKKNGNEFATTKTYYWPAAGTMDFYAIAPTSITSTDGKTVADFVADGSTDFIYALTTGQSKQNKTPAVALNFRHALSQIIFSVKLADGANLKASVKSVSIANLANKGDFTMPTESTTTLNYSDADKGEGVYETEKDGSWGTWSDKEGTATATAEPTAAVTVASYGTGAVTSADITTRDNGLLLLPQEVATAGSYVDGTGWTGLYLKVNCNICAPSADNTKDVQIFPATMGGYADIYVPITIAWKQGVIYKYNLTFGTGDTPKDGNNEDVYEAIKFSVTVDEFQTANPALQDLELK